MKEKVPNFKPDVKLAFLLLQNAHAPLYLCHLLYPLPLAVVNAFL